MCQQISLFLYIVGVIAIALLLSPLSRGQEPPPILPPSARTSLPPRQTQLPPDVLTILERGETFTLYSLEPMEGEQRKKGMERFHDWIVLGKTRIKSLSPRKKLLAALKKGISEGGNQAACFEPRHGLRAIRQGQTADLVICFSCGYIEVYSKRRALTDLPISGSAKPLFNQALKDAKVPLARDREGS